MQKTIRRQDRALSQADAEIILTEGIYGVLSTISADQTPYGMPMTYIYDHGSLYFHGATAGHRMENLLQNPNACFTVVAQNQQSPGTFTTYYRSAIAFGTITIVSDEIEKREALIKMLQHHYPDVADQHEQYTDARIHKTALFRLDISYLTAKGYGKSQL